MRQNKKKVFRKIIDLVYYSSSSQDGKKINIKIKRNENENEIKHNKHHWNKELEQTNHQTKKKNIEY